MAGATSGPQGLLSDRHRRALPDGETWGRCARDTAASAFELGVFGETTINVAPIHGAGTLALTFDRDGYAGGAVSQAGRQVNVVGALRGMGAYAMERSILSERARVEFVNNYDGNTDPAAVLRANYSFGDRRARRQARDLAGGDDILRVGEITENDGDANHLGMTTIEDGQRVVHLDSLGQAGDIASQLAAATVLQWEAHRDGRVGSYQNQLNETTRAAMAMVRMAMAIGDSQYGGVFALNDQQRALAAAMAAGGRRGVAGYVAANYDFMSGDNWLHTVQEMNGAGDLGFVSIVEDGDTMGGLIEEVYGIDPNDPKAEALVDMIVAMNPHLADRDTIEVGQELLLPNDQSQVGVDGDGNPVTLADVKDPSFQGDGVTFHFGTDANGLPETLQSQIDAANAAFNLAFMAETFAAAVTEAIAGGDPNDPLSPNANVPFDTLIDSQVLAMMFHDETPGGFRDLMFNHPPHSMFTGPLAELSQTLAGLGQQGTAALLDELNVLGMNSHQFLLAASISSQIAGGFPDSGNLPGMMSFGNNILASLSSNELVSNSSGGIDAFQGGLLVHEAIHSLRALTTIVSDIGLTTPAGQWVYNYGLEGLTNPDRFPLSYYGHSEELMAFVAGGFIPPGVLFPDAFRGILPRTPFPGWLR